MVFNDDFLEEEYASLPQYDGTEMLPVIRVNLANRPSCSSLGRAW